MKLCILFNIIFVFINTNFAHNIHIFNKYENVELKRSESSEECKNINSLLGKDESNNCCEMNGITCENGHIISMYILFF